MEKGLSNNFPNFYNDCATSLDFWGTVSKLMGRTAYKTASYHWKEKQKYWNAAQCLH